MRGDVLFLQGRSDEAVAEMEEAYAVMADRPPDAELAQLGAQLGRLCGMIGQEARGREPLERSIDIAEELGLAGVLSNALNTKGLWTLAYTNRREESRSLLLGALRVALAGNEPQAAMRAYFNLSYEREGVDDYTHAFDTDGLALAERTGDQQWKRSFLLHTSFTAAEQGDWDEAMRITHEAEESPGAETDQFAHGGILLTRSIIFARRGEIDKARAAIAASGFDDLMTDEQNLAQLWLARSEALAAEGRFADAAAAAGHGAAAAATMGFGHPAVKSSLILGSWCAYRADDRAAAAATLEQLEALPAGSHSPRLSAHRDLLRALLAAPADAPARFREAVATARAADSPWRLAIALAEQANAGVDCDAALAELTAILERLGAQAALDRLVPDASPARAAAAT
jgi:tetratricopeptide (TPR) repeat protein